MIDLKDIDLLQAWAQHSDESAFQTLVSRYGGLVKGAALRRVTDSSLAQEIAQDVFAELARQAGKLTKHTTLAGWLHRTTMLIALDRLRRLARQQKKLDQFRDMNPEPAAENPWQTAAPHLDEALDRLRSADREVLMLHYAEQLSFTQIGERLGKSSEAVRMRATRALEALAKVLRGRGVAVSLAVLGAQLGGALQPAAQAALTVTVASMASAAKISPVTVLLHTMNTMKASQVATALLLLAMATAAVFQRAEITHAEEQIAQSKASLSTMGTSGATSSSATALETKGSAQDGKSGFNFALMAQAAMDENLPEIGRLRQMLARLDDNNFGALLATIMQSSLLQVPKETLICFLLGEISERNPELALTWTMRALPEILEDNLRADIAWRMHRLLQIWGTKNPEAAATWALSNYAAWEKLRGLSDWGDYPLTVSLASGLLASAPDKAITVMDRMPSGDILRIFSTHDGVARYLKEPALIAAARWGSAKEDLPRRREILREIASRLATVGGKRDLDRVTKVFSDSQLDDQEHAWISIRVAFDAVSRTRKIDDGHLPPLKWLQAQLPPQMEAYSKGAMAHRFEPAVALTYLRTELEQVPDDDLVAGYVESADMKWKDGTHSAEPKDGMFGETAFQMATQVRDPARRQALLAAAWKDLNKDSPQRAQAMLELPELAELDRAALVGKFAIKTNAQK